MPLFNPLNSQIANATSKPTPVGADALGLWDSVTGLLNNLTLTNLAAWLASLAQSLSNKTLVTPDIGTPSAGNLANCTFPTLNQSTTGSAASLSVSGQTGVMTVAGLTSTDRVKTVRNAADTLLELGGSYTPTGTWTNMPLATPSVTGLLTLTGGQIKFPAAQSASADANTFDDYEEGTWTPVIVGLSTTGTGTYTAQTGTYTKKGREVTINAYIDWSAHTGTGNIQINGLPFTSGSQLAACFIGLLNNYALTASNLMTAYIGGSAAVITISQYQTGGGGASSVTLDTAAAIAISAVYHV